MSTATALPSVDDVTSTLGRDGYAIVEGVLSAPEVEAKRRELLRLLEETRQGRNDFEGYETRRIYALFAKTRAFDDTAMHPLVLGVLDRVLGSYQLSAPQAIQIGPGETAQDLHRDDGVYPIARPHQELVVNTMWAIDDFTEANGATNVVPGSHKWVDRAPAAADLVRRAVMPAGSVMFFVGSVFHGGGANTTGRPRLGSSWSTSPPGCGSRRTSISPSPARRRASCPPVSRSCSATTSMATSLATSTGGTRSSRSPIEVDHRDTETRRRIPRTRRRESAPAE